MSVYSLCLSALKFPSRVFSNLDVGLCAAPSSLFVKDRGNTSTWAVHSREQAPLNVSMSKISSCVASLVFNLKESNVVFPFVSV